LGISKKSTANHGFSYEMWGFCSKELPATGYLAKSSGVLVGFPTPIKRKEAYRRSYYSHPTRNPQKEFPLDSDYHFSQNWCERTFAETPYIDGKNMEKPWFCADSHTNPSEMSFFFQESDGVSASD
jgi:hypothetical protein